MSRSLLLLVTLAMVVALAGCGGHVASAQELRSATLVFLLDMAKALPPLQFYWIGMNYCLGWRGVTCAADGEVTVNLTAFNLVGSIPAPDKEFKGENIMVVSLDMSNNPGVSGDFQKEWKRMKRLRYLDLSHTSLEGRIPDDWKDMSSLESIKITNTRASGRMPDWKIASLQVIDFSNNHLSGSLSSNWGEMKKLRSVKLMGNNFCGCVPKSWLTSPALVDAAAMANGALTSPTCATGNACSGKNSAVFSAPAAATATLVTFAAAAAAILW